MNIEKKADLDFGEWKNIEFRLLLLLMKERGGKRVIRKIRKKSSMGKRGGKDRTHV